MAAVTAAGRAADFVADQPSVKAAWVVPPAVPDHASREEANESRFPKNPGQSFWSPGSSATTLTLPRRSRDETW